MTAAQKRVERAIAGALSRVDVLWNERELRALIDDPLLEGRACEILRERIVNELAGELELAVYPERFESLLDAVRMTA